MPISIILLICLEYDIREVLDLGMDLIWPNEHAVDVNILCESINTTANTKSTTQHWYRPADNVGLC